MMAGKADAVASVPCGNTVGLVGIDKYLTKLEAKCRFHTYLIFVNFGTPPHYLAL